MGRALQESPLQGCSPEGATFISQGANGSSRCKIPGSEKLSEMRLKKVRAKRRPVTMGKVHSLFWASHLQLGPEQASALIWGGL